MNQPLSQHWVQRELTPYLRYAFSHELAYDEDISPKVQAAVDFCMTKRDHPNDGNELILERICQAVDFRYKDLAPDLKVVTGDLESMARWLVRHAQVHGSYELLGRMNNGSGAWQECEAVRLEDLKLEVKKEKDNRLLLTTPPSKAAPSEDQIDPRLVLAMPGQYVGSHQDGTLDIHTDQYFREQIRRARDRRRMQPPSPSWLQQVQQAAGTQLYPQQNSDFGWLQQQQAPYDLPFAPINAPSYLQHLGHRQSPYASHRAGGIAISGMQMPADGSLGMGIMSQVPNTAIAAPRYDGGSWQNNMPANYQAAQQQMQQFPVQPPAAPQAHLSTTCAGIPVGDISHLRGKDWSNAAEQRAREFRLRGVTGMNLHQHRSQPSFDHQPPLSMYQGPNPSTQPSSTATMPFHAGVTAPMPDHIVIPHTPQPQQQPQDVEMQDRPQTGTPGFANHPGFSNVTSSFQNWQYGAPFNPASGKDKNMWG